MTRTESLPTRGASTEARGAAVRTDIQGLRAVAVSSVLLYHLWPKRLPGGFAGVDVFFVISGFLITSHLLAHPPDRLRNLLEFWSRRLRRLLPAALLVLAVTLVASRLIAPATEWGNTARQVQSATLYVVNWRLASDSVDYLAAQNAASPVQHYWSLSVEEQFYLVWPVAILILVVVARLLKLRQMPVVLGGLAVVVAASFWYSVSDTRTDPARAYFVTPTRIWELGVGGLLAGLLSRRAFNRTRETEAVPLSTTGRVVLAWLGLGAIVVTLLTYSGTTPFPSYRALLPTLGAAAVIAACAPATRWSPGPVLAVRPVQFLGDVSYSVYLWHWPLVVLVPLQLGHSLSTRDKLAIIVTSLILAVLTKRFVEDPIRKPGWGRPLIKPFALAALGMAVLVSASVGQIAEVHQREAAARTALARALSGHQKCFGAAALATPQACKPTNSGTLVPDPIGAAADKSDAYTSVSGKPSCFATVPSFSVRTCSFGDKSARIRVALVGNSHGGEWLSALQVLAKAHDWHLTTYLASQCAFADVHQRFDTDAHTQACLDWVHKTAADITGGGYDLVVMSNRISVAAVGLDLQQSQAVYEKGYVAVLSQFRAKGVPVVGIRDTPAPGTSIPDCLAANPGNYATCNGTRAQWLPNEPLTPAISTMHDPRITEADLTKYICAPSVCPAASGTVPVYFDGSHLTATYARTLAPYLDPYLQRALGR